MSVWSRIATWILDHPVPILATIAVMTVFLGYWALQVQTDHTAGQFLSSDSKVLQDFERASSVFGQSQAEMFVVFQGHEPFDTGFLAALDTVVTRIQGYNGVERVLSLTNVPYLLRQDNTLTPHRLYDPTLTDEALRERFLSQPFLQGLLLSKDSTRASLIIKVTEAINDTAERVDLVDRIAQDIRQLDPQAAFAGFPYFRTAYAKRVTAESPLFTFLAVVISLIVLFFTFRARRAITLPLLIVVLGIIWTLGLVAFFNHRLNIVTAILPALIVIIGMANAIHLTTKFFTRYAHQQDQREAVIYTVRTVGLATLLTALTTAIGFAVLVLSGSRLLAVFGKYAAAGIMLLYVLSITLIPIAFRMLKPPPEQQSRLATHDGLTRLFDRTATFTRSHSLGILITTAVITFIGIVGVTRVSSDIFVFSDFYENDPIRQDLAVFEETFGGVLPLEVVITADRPGRFRTLGALRRLERLKGELDELPPVGRSLAATDLVKLANQAYFGGHPATYRLPAGYELPFLQNALQGLLTNDGEQNLVQSLPRVVDSTFAITRIYLGVHDIGTTRMNALADSVQAKAVRLFPPDQYDVLTTGTALLQTRSGENLVNNLFVSLSVALVLISILMALLFRSARLTMISLIPNVVPLLLVGGTMGFTGIILKPSTALIFPLAFGIAVDATIHFLAKYRLMLDAGLGNDEAIRVTLRETGKALLFATAVLLSGFLVFTLSSFGGTVNMGALTALTLAVSLVANLLLLPALLHRFAPQPSSMVRSASEAEADWPL